VVVYNNGANEMKKKKIMTTYLTWCNYGFTVFELIVVIMLIGIIFAITARSIDTTVHVQRYQATIKEMIEIRKGLIGDETKIIRGERRDFGYVGETGSFPASQAVFQGNAVGAFFNSTEYKTDAWNMPYSYGLVGSTIRITSRGADRAVGAASASPFDADIMIDFPRASYINNTICITCVDARGSILRGNDGSADFHITGVTLKRIRRNNLIDSTVITCSYTNGIFSTTGISIGRYRVYVQPTSLWNNNLNQGNATPFYKDISVYPKGPNRWNAIQIRFPGTLNVDRM
jgi:prepilin-type N-terminal cleavage/methylation domain-containing protein